MVLFETNLERNIMQHQSIKKSTIDDAQLALFCGQLKCRITAHFTNENKSGSYNNPLVLT